MTFRSQFITGLLCCVLAAPLSASEFEKVIQPFFKTHCIKCHGPKTAKSNVRLDKLTGVLEDDSAAEHWQEILDVLNAGEMPPEDEPQPKTDELASVIAAMTDALHDARKRLVDPKSVTLRRLNKREYANTIQDLLGVPVDTSGLPADGTLDGFDTIGDAHFMSAPQFNVWMSVLPID